MFVRGDCIVHGAIGLEPLKTGELGGRGRGEDAGKLRNSKVKFK